MTLTVRSASVTGATTAARALTHAETDANWAHVIQSSNQSFTQSGTGGLTETVSAALQRLVHSAQYSSTANFNTARAALTGTLGLPPSIQFSNFSASAAAPWVLINGGQTFNGTYDPAFYIAYNTSGSISSARINTAEPYLKLGFEADYNNGSAHLMEINLDYTSADGVTAVDKRFLGFNIDRATHAGIWAFAATTIRLESVMNGGEVTITPATGIVQTIGQFLRSNADGSVSVPATGVYLTNTNGSSNGNASPAVYFDSGGGGGRAKVYTTRLAGSGGVLRLATDTTGATMTDRVTIDQIGGVTLTGASISMGSGDGATGTRTSITMLNGGWATVSDANTTSNGDKVVTWNGSTLKIAEGIDSGISWYQCNGSAALGFKWFGTTATTPVEQMRLSQTGDLYTRANASELATNTTGGFVHIPSCNGAPSGTPATLLTGAVPMIWDRANLQLYIYTGGAWKKSAVFT